MRRSSPDVHAHQPAQTPSTGNQAAVVRAVTVITGTVAGLTFLLRAAEGMGEAHAAVVALRVALAGNALDDPAEDASRPWPEVAAVLDRVNSELRPAADYPGMGLMLPDLITDLHAVAANHGAHRRDALGGLLHVYTAATFTAKQLGEPDLATVAAMHARAVAAELGRPGGVVERGEGRPVCPAGLCAEQRRWDGFPDSA